MYSHKLNGHVLTYFYIIYAAFGIQFFKEFRGRQSVVVSTLHSTMLGCSFYAFQLKDWKMAVMP